MTLIDRARHLLTCDVCCPRAKPPERVCTECADTTPAAESYRVQHVESIDVAIAELEKTHDR